LGDKINSNKCKIGQKIFVKARNVKISQTKNECNGHWYKVIRSPLITVLMQLATISTAVNTQKLSLIKTR